MKVLFLEHVVSVGKKGEIKEVKSGYASNFLLPKGFAVELTEAMEKEQKNKLKKEDISKRNLIENRHKLSEILNHKKIEFTLKSGENGKIYGGIGEKDIINAIKKDFKIELSKKHIKLPDGHIKKVGEHAIYIKFGKDAMAKMFVQIKGS